MKIIAELHTHTSDICDHATGTLEEYVAICLEKGIKYLASTNHGPACDDNSMNYYSGNLKKKFDGITFLAGIEEDIRDGYGGTDLSPVEMLRLEFVIASLHGYAMEQGHRDYTGAYIAAAEDPAVDCLGHIARDVAYPCDYRRVAEAVKKNNKLIEFNNWTAWAFERGEECGKVMDICAELGVNCIVTSDAHDIGRIGFYDHIMKVLEEHKFPEELIVNADEKRMEEFLTRRRSEKKEAYKALFAKLA